jgi:hypothetical protein
MSAQGMILPEIAESLTMDLDNALENNMQTSVE